VAGFDEGSDALKSIPDSDDKKTFLNFRELKRLDKKLKKRDGGKHNDDRITEKYGLRKQDNVGIENHHVFINRLAKVNAADRPVVKALSKEFVDRSKNENDLLTDYFSQVKAFKGLKTHSADLLKGISTMGCLFLPKHEVLFRYLDRGENFYVCLSGRCQLFIENPERRAIKNNIKET